MIKLCAVAALACTLGIASVAAAEQLGDPVKRSDRARLARAEHNARQAVAPLPVERAICMRRSPRTDLCFLLHQVTEPSQCRSTVIVGRYRTRVLTNNVCFDFTGVKP